MAIPPVKPGGWGPNDTARSTELAEIDSKLSTRGLDTQSTDTITGTISITNNWTVTATKTVTVTGAGAALQTVNGGRVAMGDNDNPIYSANRSRTVFLSPLEACYSYSQGDQYAVDSTNLAGSGISYGLQNQAGSGTLALTIPFAKPHDGAVVGLVAAYFLVPQGILGAALPGSFPTITLGRTTIATNAFTNLGSATFGTPASSTAYFNGGAPNVVSLTPAGNIMDPQYSFAVQLTDDSSALANRIIWTGIKIRFDSIVDARPHL